MKPSNSSDIGGYILGIGAVNKAEEVVKIILNLLFLGFGLLGLLGNIDRCLYLRYLLLGGLLRLRFFRRFLLFGGFRLKDCLSGDSRLGGLLLDCLFNFSCLNGQLLGYLGRRLVTKGHVVADILRNYDAVVGQSLDLLKLLAAKVRKSLLENGGILLRLLNGGDIFCIFVTAVADNRLAFVFGGGDNLGGLGAGRVDGTVSLVLRPLGERSNGSSGRSSGGRSSLIFGMV